MICLHYLKSNLNWVLHQFYMSKTVYSLWWVRFSLWKQLNNISAAGDILILFYVFPVLDSRNRQTTGESCEEWVSFSMSRFNSISIPGVTIWVNLDSKRFPTQNRFLIQYIRGFISDSTSVCFAGKTVKVWQESRSCSFVSQNFRGAYCQRLMHREKWVTIQCSKSWK